VNYPAQEISYTKLLGQLQDKGNTELIKNYLRLYEGAFLLKSIEKFSTNKLKVRSSSPKILPLCPAFYFLGVQAPYGAIERGRILELIVGCQLVRTGHPLYYWREKNDEVDFVLKVGKQVYAIEVKSGRKERSRGLATFKQKFPQARAVILNQENYQEFELAPLQFLERVT
jgi:predicted AAA+ superfamily ATPase